MASETERLLLVIDSSSIEQIFFSASHLDALENLTLFQHGVLVSRDGFVHCLDLG